MKHENEQHTHYYILVYFSF